MNEYEGAMQTRRTFLGLAAGLLVSGCAVGLDRVQTITDTCGSPRPSQGFPYPRTWGWNASMTANIDALGQLIMQGKNPYCQQPGGTTTNCKATDADTWPQELTDQVTWEVLTEFDFQQATNWTFAGAPLTVLRSMRIPYLVKHVAVKKGNAVANGKPLDVGRENLLVGFATSGDSYANATKWEDPTSCGVGVGRADAVGLLAKFITINMMRDTDTGSFYQSNWMSQLQPGGQKNVPWSFRNAQILVDYPFRFPVATGQAPATSSDPGVPQTAGWIYVGYEGGGAY